MTILVGMCIAINGYVYKVLEKSNGVYALEQTVIAFEEERKLIQLWRIDYVDKHAKLPKRSKGFPCL